MKPTILVISCEHAVNTIPKQYISLFRHHMQILNTHQAFDHGALIIAETIKNHFKCELIASTVSRLLIDTNRSLTNPHCFSTFTQHLSLIEKQQLINAYYNSYRAQIQFIINQYIAQHKQILHLSIHSFTPKLNGIVRNAGIGLLYNPQRHGEKEVCREWSEILKNTIPTYRTRMNYPYRGSNDGFTSFLRKIYPENDYLGIELEINQDLIKNVNLQQEITNILISSLNSLLQLLG
jgi:predicted N-formylglutamate amidohydrolase